MKRYNGFTLFIFAVSLMLFFQNNAALADIITKGIRASDELAVSGPATITGAVTLVNESLQISNTTLTSTATEARTITLPNANGTVALTSDIDLKANTANVYTKTYVDSQFALKANTADVYTKTEINTALSTSTLAVSDTANITGTLTLIDESLIISNSTLISTATTARNITLPDASGTLMLSSANGDASMNTLTVLGLLDAETINSDSMELTELSIKGMAKFHGGTITPSGIAITLTSDGVVIDGFRSSPDGIEISSTGGVKIAGDVEFSDTVTADAAYITHLVVTGKSSTTCEGPVTAKDTVDVWGVATFSTAISVGANLDVWGIATFNTAISVGANLDVWGVATFNTSVSINGDLNVTGEVIKGGGTFKIDHPLEPANKYLYHSFVESPDMMNIYNGNIITDDDGLATIELPDYFEALNKDFRYQLTCIGNFTQAIIFEKIHDNRFVIKTDLPKVEVSWQVTGIRKDPYAEQNRIQVEVEKNASERGTYLYPDLYK
ncbi:exported hypothetical protein [Candidatus Magnetomoraceae bacterium gMMP-15]